MSAMLRLITALLLSAPLLSGCLAWPQGHLYPVQGPLAVQAPAPIYTVTLSGLAGSGSMSVELADGTASGSWAVVSPQDATASKLSVQWDAVYGAGFFVAN